MATTKAPASKNKAKLAAAKAAAEAQLNESGQLETNSTNAIVQNLTKAVPNIKSIRVNIVNDVFIDKANNVREIDSYTDVDMEQMKAQIRAVGGIMLPIIVAEIEDEEESEHKPYGLLIGFRRSLSLVELADEDPAYAEDVPALLMPSGQAASAIKLTQLLENLARKELTAIEKGRTLQDILEDPESNLTAADLGQVLGMSAPNVSQLLKVVKKLPPEIQEMVHVGTFTFSHARVMVNSNAPESRYAELVDLSQGLTATEFEDKLDRLYPKTRQEAESSGEVSTGKKGDSDGQKRTSLVRATLLEKSYVPFLEQQIAKANKTEAKYTEADLIKARLDTIKTVQLAGDTILAKEIAPFLQEQERAEEEAKKNKEVLEKEEEFFKALSKQIDEILNADIDEANPEAPRISLAGAYAGVTQGVMQMSDESIQALGFPLEKKAEVIHAKLKASYEDVLKRRREDKAKKAEKKAADKAKKDAEEAAAQAKAAGGSTPATATAG